MTDTPAPSASSPVPQSFQLRIAVRTLGAFLVRHGPAALVFAWFVLLAHWALVPARMLVVEAYNRSGVTLGYSWINHLTLFFGEAPTALVEPLDVACFFILFRRLIGEETLLREMLAGYRQRRLFRDLVLVALVWIALYRALVSVWFYLLKDPAGQFVDSIVSPDSLAATVIGSIPGSVWLGRHLFSWAMVAAMLPLSWAGLEVIASGKSWFGGLVSSVRLCRTHWRPALFCLVVTLAAKQFYLLDLLSPHSYNAAGDFSYPLNTVGTFIAGLAFCLNWVVYAAATVIVYRGMVAGPDNASPELQSSANA